MTVVLGEVDVARANNIGLARVNPTAHGLVCSPSASGGQPILGATQDLPLTRWTASSTRPGLHEALEDEDDVWR